MATVTSPAVDTHGVVVGFAVFGSEARVRGQHVVEGTLDVGAGVRPEVTSRGVADRRDGPGARPFVELTLPTR